MYTVTLLDNDGKTILLERRVELSVPQQDLITWKGRTFVRSALGDTRAFYKLSSGSLVLES